MLTEKIWKSKHIRLSESLERRKARRTSLQSPINFVACLMTQERGGITSKSGGGPHSASVN